MKNQAYCVMEQMLDAPNGSFMFALTSVHDNHETAAAECDRRRKKADLKKTDFCVMQYPIITDKVA